MERLGRMFSRGRGTGSYIRKQMWDFKMLIIKD